ncbi:B-cell lymphoma/leukemia 10 [Pelobates fuscus]|uniref:B-cell lymphoma/leukemia 10 n=1 Tax=Pelobates fuscus TaxID=191477 RepID=UPI002FE440A3
MALNPLQKLSDEEMADVKRDVFESLRPYLCDKIIAERHFDYLRSKKILSKDDTEEILCQTTSRKKAGDLLDRLAKNPKGLDALIESIRLLQTQDFLIEKITDEVLRIKNKKMESVKESSLSTYMSTTNGAVSELSADEKFFAPELESTVLYHPEGEISIPLYYNPSLTLINHSLLEQGNSQNNRHSSPSSTRLPKPGEPGAPPLPCGPQEINSNSPIDNLFLPLRSSSLSAN